ncbi:glycosyltransferase family 62 protein [Pseudovirgaria hyperparasitica]|uniref:Glycosyltransferase family 62 protein n=1 Tax=Pseudovirgaria hyperparasitica TaxID=470096 RepID=A0A6A6WCA2_9PEZI|nr:glycosyltransferase family 62 protein [Pseudovirgaria hyperparasitica]KAF2759476.1 glycosyltransferase family 62 protein [Pseudovirgaria hyperparasitica]
MAGTLLPKDRFSWKSTRSRFPPGRQIWQFFTRSRYPQYLALVATILLILRGFGGLGGVSSRYTCWGPTISPMEMTPNDLAKWHGHTTPVIFNHHAPVEIKEETISYIDLNKIESTRRALQSEEKVLILTPLRDASHYLEKYFELVAKLTYPHHLIDLAFLVGDTTDDTMAVLVLELERLQKRKDKISFRSVTIVEKDFGVTFGQDVEDRHGFKAQGPRRKAMGKARNYLLSHALKPDHSWVYWRDVDIVDSPEGIIEDFVAHDRDILVPNIWFHRYKVEDGKKVDIEGRFDYNSWIESDTGRKLVKNLPPGVVLAEGYEKEGYKTGRTYMARMGDWRENKDEEIELDGIGGVNILVKADVHRSGINFPCYPFEHQAETEGFARMAKAAGYGVYGLPNYVVWHIDTDEKPGNN